MAATAVVGIVGIGNSREHVQLRGQKQGVGMVEIIAYVGVGKANVFSNTEVHLLLKYRQGNEASRRSLCVANEFVAGVVGTLARRGEIILCLKAVSTPEFPSFI